MVKKDDEGSLPAGWRENYDARTGEQDVADEVVQAKRSALLTRKMRDTDRFVAELEERNARETADPALREARLENNAAESAATQAQLADLRLRGKAGDVAANKEYERRRKKLWRLCRWGEAHRGERMRPRSYSGTPGNKRNKQRSPAYYMAQAYQRQAQAIALGIIDANKLAALLDAAKGRAEQCGDSAGADAFGHAADVLRRHENKALSAVASLSRDIGDSWDMINGKIYYKGIKDQCPRPASRKQLTKQIAAALEAKANLIADQSEDALIPREGRARPPSRPRRR